MTAGGRAGGRGPDGSKSILYKHSRVAYQIKGNIKENTMVQKICLGACLRGH